MVSPTSNLGPNSNIRLSFSTHPVDPSRSHLDDFHHEIQTVGLFWDSSFNPVNISLPWRLSSFVKQKSDRCFTKVGTRPWTSSQSLQWVLLIVCKAWCGNNLSIFCWEISVALVKRCAESVSLKSQALQTTSLPCGCLQHEAKNGWMLNISPLPKWLGKPVNPDEQSLPMVCGPFLQARNHGS
jgi:hypothetical protein